MEEARLKSIDEFLALFSKVKPIGQNQWQAQCPSHTDRNPSLNIKLLNHKILIHCHTGCQPNDIAKAVGLTMASLFLEDDRSTPSVQREIVATYPYHNATGKPVFEVVRFKPKSFSQRRFSSNGKGGYEWGLKGITPVIYHLPDVLKAIPAGDPILICEGEKDVDKLRDLGFTATCNPMGAGKWRESYTVSLKGAQETVIFPDNDGPGRKHARKVAQALFDAGIPVKVLEMPDDTIKDVTDWLGAGADMAGIKKAMAGVPPWTPDTSTLEDGVPTRYNRTDLGNAERLVALYGEEIRYCYERKSWLIWKGTHWRWDLGGEIMRFAQKTVRTIYEEAAKEDDDEERKKLAEWAKTSESNMRLNAMVEQAKPLARIAVSDLDANGWLFNCPNGTVDLKTGELYAARKEDYLTMITPVDYEPMAQSDLWDQFLDRICHGSANLITYLQRTIGYTLTGDTREQTLFFSYGTGMNGKSTFHNAFMEIMAPYAMQADTEMFLTSFKPGRSGHSEDLANLVGKRFVVASELEDGRRLAVSKLKQMTGGEHLRASHKHEREFEFVVTSKIWLSGNHKPDITDTTCSIWRRVKLIPFTVTIPKAEQDKALPNKLQAVYPSLLAWAVQGCLDWQEYGLKEPVEITQATEEYRHEQDILGEFIHACCVLEPVNPESTASNKAMYAAYQGWCSENSIDPVTSRTFSKRLNEKQGIHKFTSMGQIKWRFIRLRREDEERAVDEVDEGENFTQTSPYKDNIENNTDNSPTTSTSSTGQLPLERASSTPSTTPDDGVGEVAEYPTAPCFVCKNKDYWLAPGNKWLCTRCHPEPKD